jgi:hypothetical protein
MKSVNQWRCRSTTLRLLRCIRRSFPVMIDSKEDWSLLLSRYNTTKEGCVNVTRKQCLPLRRVDFVSKTEKLWKNYVHLLEYCMIAKKKRNDWHDWCFQSRRFLLTVSVYTNQDRTIQSRVKIKNKWCSLCSCLDWLSFNGYIF